MLGFFSRLAGRAPDRAPAAQQVEPRIVPEREPAPAAQISNEGKAPTPLTQWDSGEMLQLLGGVPSWSGAVVTPDSAMRVSTVYACVRLIAGAIASMPVHVFKRLGDGDKERASNHTVEWVLNQQPSPLMTPFLFIEYLVTSCLLRGDGFAVIQRNLRGDILGLVTVDPSRVMVDKRGGILIYLVQDDDGKWYAVDQGDMIHIPGCGFDGRRGKSVIGWAARQGIGIALAAEEYSARFFSNGARPDVVLTFPNRMTETTAKLLLDYWERKHQGVSKAHLPAILTEGGKIEQLSLTAEDAQLMEARKFQVIDICRAFGVPPYLVGETEKTTSWGSGIETMGLGFVVYTLRYHLTKIEQEFNRKLLPSSRFFAEFVLEGLLRGDSKARAEFYKAAIGGNGVPGWLRPNEARRKENLPPDPDGDTLYTPPANAAPAPAGKTDQPDDQTDQQQEGQDDAQA